MFQPNGPKLTLHYKHSKLVIGNFESTFML